MTRQFRGARPAIEHVNFPKVVTALTEKYEVMVTVLSNAMFTTILGRDTLGYFDEERKAIFISPGSPWESLLHEASHVSFAKKIGKLGERLNKFEKAVSEAFARNEVERRSGFSYSKNIARGFNPPYVTRNLMYFQQRASVIYNRSLRYGSSKYVRVHNLFNKYLSRQV